MKRLTLFAAVLTLVACGKTEEDAFREGYPSPEMVRIDVPGAGSAEQGVRRDGLEGQVSGMYAVTRGATFIVNAGVGLVLGLLDAITEHPPTSLSSDTAVWGPHTDPLSPNTWKLTVKRVAQDQYEYKLEGKAKNAPDSDFVAVLSGSHSPATDANGNAQERFGHGTFLLDWDAAQTLPEHDHNVGKAAVTYSRVSASAPVTVEVTFTQVKDEETGGLVDARYSYEQAPGADGSFQFGTQKNIGAGAAVEKMTIKSRWTQNGAGRSDVQVTGGDFASAQTLNECWDANFASRFLAASWDVNAGYGQESACAFTPAEYASF